MGRARGVGGFGLWFRAGIPAFHHRHSTVERTAYRKAFAEGQQHHFRNPPGYSSMFGMGEGDVGMALALEIYSPQLCCSKDITRNVSRKKR